MIFAGFKEDAECQVPIFFLFSQHTLIFSYFIKQIAPIFLFLSLFTFNLYFMYFFSAFPFSLVWYSNYSLKSP